MSNEDVLLSDLQSLGERYSPVVLREYFTTHGYSGSVPAVPLQLDLPRILEIDVSRIVWLSRVGLLWYVGTLLAGLIWFACATEWTVANPVVQENVIAAAVPVGVDAVLILAGLAGSVATEFWAARPFPSSWLGIAHAVASVCGQVAFAADAISAVILGELLGGPVSAIVSVSVVFVCYTSTHTCRQYLPFLLLQHCDPNPSAKLLTNSINAFLSCFAFQLVLLPVKLFFLLDFGHNFVVAVSVATSVIASCTTCVATVIPSRKPTVAHYALPT